MEQWMPAQVLGRLRRLPRSQWYAFFGVWVAGLFAHGYMLANKLPNHDDIHSMFGKGAIYESGRWGLPVIGKLDGSFSSSWMLGLFTLFLLAVTAMLMVDIMRIRSPLFGALAGGALAVFPTLTSLFGYMFTSDAYAVSVLLTVLAAWLCCRQNRGWLLLAAACLVASLSIYQAFFGFAAALLVYRLYADCIREEADAKTLFLTGVWQAGALAAGMAAYLFINQRVLAWQEASMTGYMQLDQMGQIHPSLIPGQLIEAYRMFFLCWQGTVRGMAVNTQLQTLLKGCVLLLTLLVVWGILRQFLRGKPWEGALALLLAGMFPVAVNLICLMNPARIHSLMVYPMCMLPISLAARCDAWCAEPPLAGRRALVRVAGSWAVVACVALLVLRYGMLDNKVYLQLQLNHTQRLSYWTSVVTQIKSTPGYTPETPVALIDDENWDPTVPHFWQFDELESLTGTSAGMSVFSNEDFLPRYLGFSPTFVHEADLTEAQNTALQQMPHYPAEGSIRIVDGVVLVRFCG